MCVVSAVHDHFNRMIPGIPVVPAPLPWIPMPSTEPVTPTPVPDPATFFLNPTAAQIAELQALIARFERAVAAAKVVDELTGKADCLDPDKAKLEERVAYWKARALAAEKLLEGGA